MIEKKCANAIYFKTAKIGKYNHTLGMERQHLSTINTFYSKINGAPN